MKISENTHQPNSNDEIWELIDKEYQWVLIPNFNPHEVVEWVSGTVTIDNSEIVTNHKVRMISFDILLEINDLKKVINLNTRNISIFQFDREVSDTLVIDHLPDSRINEILFENGLKYIYNIHYEFMTIQKFE
ncbi:hypothetical protein SAMN05421640_0038 [Ekhidna lutea]|uniref:Uncharacterized protein n=1 Tax=Ekhidna lutea TaxID=447679 RepID=A0A239EBJ2_EKHLU|nr:hypothetical protein [Ekhidna lutea]SNS41294.1 hypothetical protein SAMN05421640_0038 [Ekhidna lutea]